MRTRRSATAAGEGAGKAARRSAYDKILGMLARREHSRYEIESRLARDGYPADEVETALAALLEAGYQSDTRFAEMLVRSRVRQGYGPQRLRAELRTHRIADELVDTCLADAEADWLEQARDQLRRRYGGDAPDDYRERAKRMQFLVRRGFSASTAHAAVAADGGAD